MPTILITGGTGLIGKHLSKHLTGKGYKVIILTRSAKEKNKDGNISYAHWDTEKQLIDIQALQSADAIIHLAGAGVADKRWTTAYKKEILGSRVKASKLIIDTLRDHSNQVKTIVSASAIGWYGPDKDKGWPFVETDPPFTDFLAQTCVAWEQSTEAAATMGIRVCRLRCGIVLSSDGGALEEFIKPLKFGIAAILGNGKQVISWIHIDDLCRLYIHALENSSMNGNYNAVASTPVSNKAFTLLLAKTMRSKFFIPIHVPAFVLKLVLGESSIEVLKSTTVSNAKARETGFTFFYPSVDAAIPSLVK